MNATIPEVIQEQITKASRILRIPESHLEALWLHADEMRLDFSKDATQEAARHVLWVRGNHEYGWQPGSFTQSLLTTWDRADVSNRVRLRVAFPLLTTAMEIGRREGDEGIIAWAQL
ncbi:hypothetical protein PBI_DEWDROP_106 [Microbacterium phage Dewdrop]|nr:hypothetical protein PBI_LEAF_106 [Microbacterium phage Leaf]QGZ17474.1 hypothetical protein PBI_DEWDROP_106 [Microbacterium phage Dewdrop]